MHVWSVPRCFRTLCEEIMATTSCLPAQMQGKFFDEESSGAAAGTVSRLSGACTTFSRSTRSRPTLVPTNNTFDELYIIPFGFGGDFLSGHRHVSAVHVFNVSLHTDVCTTLPVFETTYAQE